MSALAATPGQTVGPFFRYGLEFDGGGELIPPHTPGAIRLHGTVYDGEGASVPDALIEIWHADASGAIPRAEGSLRRDGQTFTGFGRVHTDEDGGFEFWTVRPDADFIPVIVFARGLLDRLHTRAYLPGRSDAFLESLSETERATLTLSEDYRFDIRLQGEGETVFVVFE